MTSWKRKLLEKPASVLSRFCLATRLFSGKWAAFLLHLGLAAENRTMVSRRRLWQLFKTCSEPSLPDGSLVECGVARGGCVAVMSLASGGRRPVFGFDSFEGMPSLTAEDQDDGQEWVGFQCSGPKGLEEAQETLRRFHVAGAWVNLIPGFFESTLPDYTQKISPIAVLRLDNDWYKSTRYCLERLYSEVALHGVIIIDDYHAFAGCKKAVDEFREQRGIKSLMITAEATSEVFWRKTD